MGYGYPYPSIQYPGATGYYSPGFQANMPNQQTAANVTWIYVNGWDGARNQIVQPGQTAWMMDNNDPIIYIKAVDGMGSASLRGFTLTEITQQGANTGAPGAGRYATTDDVNSAVERIARLETAMNTLLNELGGAKNESAGANHG